MKQTAVEWYHLKVIELMRHREQGNIDVLEFRNQLDLLFKQAKQMEKEQIIKSAQDNFYAGQDLENGYKLDWNSAEEYYNVTFKSE